MVNYNFIDKILHELFLGNSSIKKICFELERFLFIKNCEKLNNNIHLFITGMPRSGTTIFLKFIYSSNNFASLTYEDMPFILAPNLFSFLKKKKNFNQIRLHDDKISIELKSPEAFDEVFFKTFSDEEKFNFFDDYVNLILKKFKKKRYLSKNNNLIPNLKVVNQKLPNSQVLVMFRDPLQQSISLLKQHLNFKHIQSKDRFILRYMDYLGHNEFGLNHKNLDLSSKFTNPDTLDYWLEKWIKFYENILELAKKNERLDLINYKKFCIDDDYQKQISRKYKFDYFKPQLIYPKDLTLDSIDLDNFNESQEIYFNLEKKSLLNINN